MLKLFLALSLIVSYIQANQAGLCYREVVVKRVMENTVANTFPGAKMLPMVTGTAKLQVTESLFDPNGEHKKSVTYDIKGMYGITNYLFQSFSSLLAQNEDVQIKIGNKHDQSNKNPISSFDNLDVDNHRYIILRQYKRSEQYLNNGFSCAELTAHLSLSKHEVFKDKNGNSKLMVTLLDNYKQPKIRRITVARDYSLREVRKISKDHNFDQFTAPK